MFVLRFYPCHQYGYGILLFFIGEFSSGGDVMPFVEASSATAAGGVLGEEHWMASHWCLLAVICYDSRSKPSGHKVTSMMPHRGKSFLLYVIQIPLLQVKFAAKRRCRKPCKKWSISI